MSENVMDGFRGGLPPPAPLRGISAEVVDNFVRAEVVARLPWATAEQFRAAVSSRVEIAGPGTDEGVRGEACARLAFALAGRGGDAARRLDGTLGEISLRNWPVVRAELIYARRDRRELESTLRAVCEVMGVPLVDLNAPPFLPAGGGEVTDPRIPADRRPRQVPEGARFRLDEIDAERALVRWSWNGAGQQHQLLLAAGRAPDDGSGQWFLEDRAPLSDLAVGHASAALLEMEQQRVLAELRQRPVAAEVG